MQPIVNQDMLNQSIPDHFEMMKHQDSINEKRPSMILQEGFKLPEGQGYNDEDSIEEDTNNILKDPSLK